MTEPTFNLEQDIDTDSEKEVDDSEKDIDFLRDFIYEDDHVKFYSTDARDFVNNTTNYFGQRDLNETHVNNLVQNVLKTNHFVGTIKIVRDKNDKLRMIDGQHRFEALKRIMKINSKFNINLIIELYDTDLITSDKTISLYNSANNVLNVNVEDLSSINAHKTIKKLDEKFPRMIMDIKDGTRCNRPRMCKKELYQDLKNIFINNDVTSDFLTNRILQENNEAGLLPRSSFKNVSQSTYNKAKESGFYIGLYKNIRFLKF